MPKAKKELSKLGCYSTPLEKVRCLKRTFACINELSNGFKNLSSENASYKYVLSELNEINHSMLCRY